MIQEQKQTQALNIDAAFRRLMRKLTSQGFKIKDIMPINSNRYIIIKGVEKNIMIMYKRAVFFNFAAQFRSKGQKGVGETINRESIKSCVRNDVEEIYVTYPNGIAYKITLQEFLDKSFRWVNKEGREVYSTSIHNFKRAFII